MNAKKRIVSLLLASALIMSSLSACNNSTTSTNSDSSTTSGAVTTVNTTAESKAETTLEGSSSTGDSNLVNNLYNPNFKIELLSDGIKKVTDGDGRELVLVPKELAEVPAEYKDSTVIRTPVENAVFLSSSQVCTFRTVDSASVIKGIGAVCGGADVWSTVPAISEKLTSGDIIDVTGSGEMGEPDYEKIQALNPDVVFVYSGEYGQVSQIAKLKELGINYAVDNEYLESDYLARMEWMRFILTFFNADNEIETVMEKAKENVDAQKAIVAKQEKVNVAIFSIYDGSVYATSDSSWVGSMIADMNGTNVFSGMDTSSLTLEAAFEKIENADVIIYTSTPLYCAGLEGVKTEFPQLTDCKAYKNNKVYQYSDAFWNGIDQSDIMAGDLAAAMYPELFADRTLSYFVKLDK